MTITHDENALEQAMTANGDAYQQSAENRQNSLMPAPEPCAYCAHVGLPVQYADEWPACGYCGGV